jgi:hypothetical protein
MSMYIDLSVLQKPGEERSALIDTIAESLNEAAVQELTTVKVVLISFRVFPDGREDRGKQAAPLNSVNADTADSEQIVNQIITRFERSVGQGFKGRMLIAVEDPAIRGVPLAGTWERYVTGEGTTDPDAYGNYGEAYAGRQADPGHYGAPQAAFGGGQAPPPRIPPPQDDFDFPEPAAAPRMGGSHLMGGSMMGPSGGGFDPSYDPGQMPDQSAQENAELFRSILGSAERRIDQAHQETRFFQGQSTTMLEYLLRQNAQMLGLVNTVLHVGLTRGGGGGAPPGPRFHPLGELAGSLLTAFLGAPPQPENPEGAPVASPPRFAALPPAEPAFFHPVGNSADIGGDSFYANGWQPEPEPTQPPPGPGAPPPGFSGDRAPTPDEWATAFDSDPKGAMAVAATKVPAPFRGFLQKGSKED